MYNIKMESGTFSAIGQVTLLLLTYRATKAPTTESCSTYIALHITVSGLSIGEITICPSTTKDCFSASDPYGWFAPYKRATGR